MVAEDMVEVESLKDLERIVADTRLWGMRLVLIGGYAVRAYTQGYRYTKDIDFVTLKKDTGKLIALLKGLGYDISDTNFGLAGRKTIDGGFIDLHISVGEVYDTSTDKRYPVSEETLAEAEEHVVSGFLAQGRELRVVAPAVSFEDLLIMKLMTRTRGKDRIDVVSLLLDRGSSVDIEKISKRCGLAGLSAHIRKNVQEFIGGIRTQDITREWERASGRRLLRKEETSIIKLLKSLERKLA